MGGDVASEAEGVGVFAHCGDAEGDVFFQGNAKLSGAVADIVAIDTAGEGFVFQTLFDGIDFQIKNTLGRADIRARGKKSGKLIARE